METKPKVIETTDHTVSVPVKEYPGGILFFREAWAGGEVGGQAFELSRSLNGGVLVVSIAGRHFALHMPAMIEAICAQLVKDERPLDPNVNTC